MAEGDMRVAIVGCGRMGRIRAEAARALGCRVHAVHDPRSDAACELAGAEAAVLESPEELSLEDLDAVFVCTPPSERGAVERACIAARKPFFAEKPVGLSAESGLALLRAMGSNRIVTAVGYMNRYRRSVQDVRSILRKEALLGLSAVWMCGPYARDWWQDDRRSGGPINEQATHMIDLCRYLGGEITDVAAVARPSPVGRDAVRSCAITMRWEDGALGTLLYSCEAEEKSIGLRAVTPRRTLALEGWDLNPVDVPVPEDTEDVFLTETRAFLEAVRDPGSSRVRIDLREAVRTQAVVDSVLRAVRTGAWEAVT